MGRPVFPVVVLAFLLCAAPATAQDGADRLAADCQDDRIDGRYTQAEFQEALRELPADIDEYSACRDTIRRAQLRAAAAGAADGGDGSAAALRARGGDAVDGADAAAGAVAGERASSGSSRSTTRSGSGRAASGSGAASSSPPAPADGAGAQGGDASPRAPAGSEVAAPAGARAGAGAAAAGEHDAVGTAVAGVGRAATPAVTPPATARALGLLGALLLAGLGAALWMARGGRA